MNNVRLSIKNLCGELPPEFLELLLREDEPLLVRGGELNLGDTSQEESRPNPSLNFIPDSRIMRLYLRPRNSESSSDFFERPNFDDINLDGVSSRDQPVSGTDFSTQASKGLINNFRKNLQMPALKRQLQRKTMVSKRFNRQKLVEMDSENLKRIVKNLVWLRFSKPINYIEAQDFLNTLSQDVDMRPPVASFQLDRSGKILQFHVPFQAGLTADDVINSLSSKRDWFQMNGILDIGKGIPILTEASGVPYQRYKSGGFVDSAPEDRNLNPQPRNRISRASFVAIIIFCTIALITALLLFLQYMVRSGRCFNRKGSGESILTKSQYAEDDTEKMMHKLSSESPGSPPPYHDSYVSEKPQETKVVKEAFRQKLASTGGSEASVESMAAAPAAQSTRLSSNSSWSEEPVQMQIDVKTGHLILSYMEERLRNRDRLDADWAAISSYESEEAVPCEAANKPENACKNREGCPVPYEQTRVLLSNRGNVYINASLVFDHDPRTPTYIAAETPLPGTVAAFWQMVWEQFAVVIVCLEPDSSLEQVMENCLDSGCDSVDTTTQARYWPPEGCSMYGKFEVRFVSEHSSCGDFIIRSFYLKEVESGETRTITQFHFLKWLEDVPSCDVKTVLDFRRKVNKSFRAKKSPVVVHCIDGSGKTGTYLLIDLVLNRINKGVKELDVAASIEHLRDQRHGMIKSKEQFKFVLASIAEEVNSMLNAVG
uniref:Receptor-type tyrosine-protein phosphatase-like N n=1 Tax=Schistocephalus solidus TaxID=70667 RepID=A0A0X3PZ41_SCHSO